MFRFQQKHPRIIDPLRDRHRRRWMRANAHLYVRPDACRFMPSGAPRYSGKDAVKYFWPELKTEPSRQSSTGRLDNTADDIIATHEYERQLLAERQELLKLKSDLLWFRLELKFRQYLHALKYSPDQPRVAAGNPDGGRWTSDGDGGTTDRRVLSDETPDPIKPGAQYAGGAGHHWAARKVFENKKYSFRPETLKVFENATSGPLNDPTSNRYDYLHRQYNAAVEESLDRYLERNKIQSSQMTPTQARSFVEEIKTSRDPRIYRFILRLRIFEALHWYRGPRGRE